jgi:hypothetical protein
LRECFFTRDGGKLCHRCAKTTDTPTFGNAFHVQPKRKPARPSRPSKPVITPSYFERNSNAH